MNNQLFLCCFLFCAFAYSQENKKNITGKVFFEGDVMSDVHIINKNSNIGTNTNDFGLFEISATIGDTLVFSHINIKAKTIAITKEIFVQEIFIVDVEDKTYVLDEITLGTAKSIFFVDPEIMPPTRVNAKTLHLPYANSIAKKDYSVVKFRSGGVVSLDNLINALNGNNRRRKQLEKITLEDKRLAKIRKYFTDDFFYNRLKHQTRKHQPFFKLLL